MTARLTDNLPLLAGAPNGIKKLRELILELAVRGKLVEQDVNDDYCQWLQPTDYISTYSRCVRRACICDGLLNTYLDYLKKYAEYNR